MKPSLGLRPIDPAARDGATRLVSGGQRHAVARWRDDAWTYPSGRMACECIETINANLAEHNLDTAIIWGRERNTLEARTYTDLKRRDNGRSETRRGKPRLFAHTFCPFCGARYEVEEPKPVSSADPIAMLDDPAVAGAVNEHGGRAA